MAGEAQPLSDQFPIVGPDGRPTIYFIQWAQERQIDITAAVTADQALAIVVAYIAAHTLHEGSGIQITPSGNLADNPTIAADAQEILDQISSTRGSILYRGALGWAARVPGTASYILTSAGAGADPIWAAPAAGTVAWGSITGVLSAQTDLQTALNGKLSVIDDSIDWGAGALAVSPAPVFSIGYAQVEGAIAMVPHPTSIPRIFLANLGYTATGWIGGITAHSRVAIGRDGTVTGWEFDAPPYVNNDVIFYAGNLAFGTGLSYVAGVLTATASGGVLPVVDGSIPPVFLQNPDGSLIYTPI